MYTIAFAGGGTAGHVMPNLAIISALGGDCHCVYIGCDGMEKSLCEARGIPFYTISAVKLRRDKFFKNLAVPFKLHACVRSAKKVLDEIKPDLIFSKGGYAALPVVLGAGRIPVVSHESDFSPGLCTKLAKRKSQRILCAFEPCAARIKRAEHVGAPLNPALYRGKSKRAAFGFDGSKPVIAVVGGSSGAAAINDCVKSALPKLTACFDVIHVTGKGKAVCEKQRGYRPIEFENDMPGLYASVDMIVTRGGANALAEAIALKIPALCVPLEKASRGDQLQNAHYYEERGAIKVLRESDMTPTTLAAAVAELFNAKDRYARAMSELSVDGTKQICDIIKETLNKN